MRLKAVFYLTVTMTLTRSLVVGFAAALWTMAPLRAQTLNPSARAVISQSRSLTPAEIAQVLAAVREAIAGKTVRLAFKPDGPGPELVMADDGRPRLVRAVSGYTSWSGSAANGIPPQTRDEHVDVREVTEFTRRPALRCDGSRTRGELVIEYRNENEKGWTAKARASTQTEFASTIFDMLTGVTAVASGVRETIDSRTARALVAPWTLPPGAMSGGPLPRNVAQSLWIDVDSLLPLRWDLGTPDVPAYRLSFRYEALDIRPPDGVRAPACIE